MFNTVLTYVSTRSNNGVTIPLNIALPAVNETVKDKMKPFSGQKQRYFLVRLDQKAKIKLDTEIPEFVQHKFVGLDTLFSTVAHFKRPVYKEVVRYFQKQGYL